MLRMAHDVQRYVNIIVCVEFLTLEKYKITEEEFLYRGKHFI